MIEKSCTMDHRNLDCLLSTNVGNHGYGDSLWFDAKYGIETLNGSNYKKWKRDLEMALGFLDYDLAIRKQAPKKPAEGATIEEKAHFAKWEKANRMTILIMLKSMSPTVKGGIPPSNNAKEFLESISLKFKESEKAKMGSLINKLTDMRYAGNGCARVHILNMIDVGMNLRGYGVNLDDNMLVHLSLNSLPIDFKQIKSSYVAQKESWSINYLIAICV
ncbi:unnamed protein product [Prunus armeniaca]